MRGEVIFSNAANCALDAIRLATRAFAPVKSPGIDTDDEPIRCYHGRNDQGLAQMPVGWKGSVDLLREIAMVGLGVILAIVPLALWVAWSETVFVTVLAVGTVAMGLILALISLGPEDDQRPRTTMVSAPELIAEIQQLAPITDHHRQLGDPRLAKMLAVMRAMMRRPDA